MEQQQSKFDGWAIVEVFGHQKYAGYVTTEAFGAAVMFRVDVPALEERERQTKGPGYVGGRYLPAGSKVQEGAVAGYSKLLGVSSIFAITPCTKDAALKVVEVIQPRPLMNVTLPDGAQAALPPHVEYDDDYDDDDDIVDDKSTSPNTRRKRKARGADTQRA